VASQLTGLAEQQTMRNGQNKRMRGRNNNNNNNNNRKGGHHQNPLSRVYESNGQDVKIRGTASHIAEKYLQLARDAQSSGDTIATENYYQHAEHYFRLIAAAQEQLRQTQPYFQQQGGQGGDGRGNSGDDGYDDDNEQPHIGGEPFAPREPQSFYPRDSQQNQPQQHQPQQDQPQQNQPQQYQPQHRQPQHQPQPHYQPRQQHVQPENDADVERLPSFITGGQAPSQQPPQSGQGANGPNSQNGPQNGSNGPNGYDGSPDRFPLHRRRRRHRGSGPRDHAMDHSAQGEGDGQPSSGPQPPADE
jgi:hypothetical protein